MLVCLVQPTANRPQKRIDARRALHVPQGNRSDWQQLTDAAAGLLEGALSAKPRAGGRRKALLVAESFGGCLALRVAAQAGHLLHGMALINPATCFARSYGGLPGLVAQTNLLSAFPQPLYEVRCHAPTLP